MRILPAAMARIRAKRLMPPLLATGILALALALGRFAGWHLRGFGSAIEIFLVFLWLAYLATLARGKLRDGLIVVGSLVLGLSVLEVIAVKSAKTSFPVVGKGFSVNKQGIGWGPSGPGVYPARKVDPRTGAIIYDVTYTIDNSLLRKTVSIDGGSTIAFFGDSFTFGEGVNDIATMPQAFADLTAGRVRVLNLGFSGYGPQQVLHELETGLFDTTLGHHVRLLVLMTAPWHAERTSCKPTYALRGPRYRLLDGHVARSGACGEGLSLMWREWVQATNLFRLAIDPYWQRVDRNDLELYIRIVQAVVELAKQKYGARVLIPFIPAGDDYLRHSGFTDRSIVERLQEAGGAVIDASLAKEKAEGTIIEIPGDGHPTPFAHSARAQSIKAYVAEELPDLLTR